jgi:hypothetical protein
MARMINENDNLRREIQELKLELEVLKIEMNKFKEFMNTKASFVDFKVFKFNEDQEKLRQAYWNELPNQRGDLDSLWGNTTEEFPF